MPTRNQPPIEGVIPILPTPFNDQGEVYEPDFTTLLNFCEYAGVGACGLPAYGSEYYKLTQEEVKRVIESAVSASDGRIPIVAQCNSMNTDSACLLAKHSAKVGANAIALELPRRFPYSDNQLMEFATTVGNSVDLPILIQDWNPGGTTVDATFVATLHKRCPNVIGIKLEEPNLGEKVRAIIDQTKGNVKVFEGWGGLYTLELLPAGISGIMPGTALADVMVAIFNTGQNDPAKAYDLAASFTPYLVFSLQNMEHFHHVEKAMLQRRGILSNPYIRDLTVELDSVSKKYLNLVLNQTCKALESHGFPIEPLN